MRSKLLITSLKKQIGTFQVVSVSLLTMCCPVSSLLIFLQARGGANWLQGTVSS